MGLPALESRETTHWLLYSRPCRHLGRENKAIIRLRGLPRSMIYLLPTSRAASLGLYLKSSHDRSSQTSITLSLCEIFLCCLSPWLLLIRPFVYKGNSVQCLQGRGLLWWVWRMFGVVDPRHTHSLPLICCPHGQSTSGFSISGGSRHRTPLFFPV